jgi:Protein of unknown function (DUF1616)
VRGHRDLQIVTATTLICAVMSPLLPIQILSLLFALPLALLLPGYALSAAIFARRKVGPTQFAVLSLGLSLCVLALGALLLNYLPGGIGPVSWAVLLALIALNGCRVAALRRPPAEKAPTQRARPQLRLTAAGSGFLAGALLCTAAALALSFTTVSAKHADGYTALWLLPPAPVDTAAGGARVGVDNEQQQRTSYILRVRIGGEPGEMVRSFSLDPAETRVLKLAPTPQRPSGAPTRVSAELFLQRKPEHVFRRVSGWLTQPRAER